MANECCEAMREAAAKLVLDMRDEDYSTMTGASAVRLRNQIVVKAIRALPLPVSADGSANTSEAFGAQPSSHRLSEEQILPDGEDG